MKKKNLVSGSLNEYMELGPEGIYSDNILTFEDLMDTIDNTRGKKFSSLDIKNFIDYLTESGIRMEESMNLIKYLFSAHPELNADIAKEESPVRKILDDFFNRSNDIPNVKSYNFPPRHLN